MAAIPERGLAAQITDGRGIAINMSCDNAGQ
jgi:hypothetical protein